MTCLRPSASDRVLPTGEGARCVGVVRIVSAERDEYDVGGQPVRVELRFGQAWPGERHGDEFAQGVGVLQSGGLAVVYSVGDVRYIMDRDVFSALLRA